jgi:anaerobic magnesium-protoporphyrin IX monomethyl ester cyclase
VADIVPFNVVGDSEPILKRAMLEQPELVGLSIQFQHRAHEFLALSRALRRAGYRGHITTGAQFPTLAYKEVIEGDHGVDSVVFHDGEETIVDLANAIENGAPIHDVGGLALRGSDGAAFRTGERRMPDELDNLPFAKRYRAHNRHMGVPFVPLIGGRGCWSKCSYCSIVAFYRDGREHGGGRLFRMRSPENVAQEMALLWHREGGPCIFCFHDDNFTLPSAERTLERVRAIRGALDDYGVGLVGIVGKARPDTITPSLAKGLAELGVIRLYVGVENASQQGGDNLRRGTQQKHVREALASCREAGIFNCYNLLMFEPGASLEHIHENAAFIREHADHPVNFCRAEPYHGTPLHLEMSRHQDLGGSYLGWNYRIGDDRAELVFRVCSAAFRERNFAPRGVANRYMGLGYAGNVLRRFYASSRAELLRERARLLTRAISLDTAEHLYRAIELVENTDLSDRDRFERLTARLALDVSAKDRMWHEALDEIYGEMAAFVNEPRAREMPKPTAKLLKLARSVTLGASIMAVASAASGCECSMVVDPVPEDSGRPIDAGRTDAGRRRDAGSTREEASTRGPTRVSSSIHRRPTRAATRVPTRASWSTRLPPIPTAIARLCSSKRRTTRPSSRTARSRSACA